MRRTEAHVAGEAHGGGGLGRRPEEGPSRPSAAPPSQDELLQQAMQEEMMRSSRQGRGSNPFRKIEMPKMVEVRSSESCFALREGRKHRRVLTYSACSLRHSFGGGVGG